MELLQLSLLGGALALDATAVGQFMVSRPLVAGALTGWLLGDPQAGTAVGAILELYLLVSFPTGGSRFPEGATATVVAAAAAAGGSPGGLALAVACGLVWGQVAGGTITWMRHFNARLVPDPDRRAASSSELVAAHVGAMLVDFVRGAVVTCVGVVLTRALVDSFEARWPLAADSTMGLLLVGASVSIGILTRDFGGFRKRVAAFTAGLALAVLGAGLM